ncbi:MAG: hypothetical protein QNJ16_10645 [Rhodobacter sp.]|nr:hypothetical protein [Rhodobacter sp.]
MSTALLAEYALELLICVLIGLAMLSGLAPAMGWGGPASYLVYADISHLADH